jgi:hypothetical protein
MATVVTYNVVEDLNCKLKATAKIACNFWNRFITPKSNTIIRLEIFTSQGPTIAESYKPWEYEGSWYGRIRFNTKYLGQFTDYDIAGTIIHEIGHTLGFGWDLWMSLFDPDSAKFYPDPIKRVEELEDMLVETEGGPGTEYSHWDEETFRKELMTGYKDAAEHVLPVTIKVMALLGHGVNENLNQKTDLEPLMRDAATVVFSRREEVQKLNLEHFRETPLMEEVFAGGTR